MKDEGGRMKDEDMTPAVSLPILFTTMQPGLFFILHPSSLIPSPYGPAR